MPVPVYIDGVFLGRGQGLGIELIEPERVEILRGPQGQLFGRNAEGGVVQYVSRKPSGELGIRASASYGNYDDQRIKASIDLPAVGGLSTQLSGVISSHDPYTEMSSRSLYPNGATPPGPPNEGHNVLDTSGFRFAGRWQNAGSFTADYSYDYSDEFSSEGYLTWLDVDVARPAFALNPPTEELPGTTFERLYNPGFQVYTSGHNLTLAWDMSDTITLKSISSYREVSRKGGNSLGTSLVAGGSSTGLIYTWAFEQLEQDQTSQELQLIGSWDQFDLTVGAMYFNEEVEDFRRSNLTGPGLTPPGLGINPALQYCVALALDPVSNHQRAAGSGKRFLRCLCPGQLPTGVRAGPRTHARRALHGRPEGREPHTEQQSAGRSARGIQCVACRPGGLDQVPVERRHPDVPALCHWLSCGRRQRAFVDLHQLRRGGERGLGTRPEVAVV